MTIAEPAVTLTDYALTVECALFAVLLAFSTNASPTQLRKPFVIFFFAAALATLAGGTVHGFWHDETSSLYHVAWNTAMLATGLVALMGWTIGARLLFSDPHRIRFIRFIRVAGIAGIAFAVYATIILTVSNSFLVAVLFYLPATLFLLTAFLIKNKRQPARAHQWGITGLVLLFVAAAIQQFGFSLHPTHFDHNALFHLVQATGLAFIFIAATKLSRQPHFQTS